jgi:short-subunit dehydrogenase involved in D-alanine esterification of teichoic acids
MVTELSPSSVLVVDFGPALAAGAAIGRRFARAGNSVVIAGRNEAKLSAT